MHNFTHNSSWLRLIPSSIHSWWRNLFVSTWRKINLGWTLSVISWQNCSVIRTDTGDRLSPNLHRAFLVQLITCENRINWRKLIHEGDGKMIRNSTEAGNFGRANLICSNWICSIQFGAGDCLTTWFTRADHHPHTFQSAFLTSPCGIPPRCSATFWRRPWLFLSQRLFVVESY